MANEPIPVTVEMSEEKAQSILLWASMLPSIDMNIADVELICDAMTRVGQLNKFMDEEGPSYSWKAEA